jgi:hypothetical protein
MTPWPVHQGRSVRRFPFHPVCSHLYKGEKRATAHVGRFEAFMAGSAVRDVGAERLGRGVIDPKPGVGKELRISSRQGGGARGPWRRELKGQARPTALTGRSGQRSWGYPRTPRGVLKKTRGRGLSAPALGDSLSPGEGSARLTPRSSWFLRAPLDPPPSASHRRRRWPPFQAMTGPDDGPDTRRQRFRRLATRGFVVEI